ncbi:hypothetical protein [Amycolatopsis xylanica]|uniref:hypothetical protein n=1 Tax=Amycolatopsis xylanica TaxID=589385 RepID=UPI00115FF358|nr:hypothetical protein [Amycolatopsis xylanica]
MSQAERDVLHRVLSERFDGHEQLLAQVDEAEVTALWDHGSVSVDLRVPAARGGTARSGPIPVRALVNDESGDLLGEVLVWVNDGKLAALEYAWYGDDMPSSWPDPANISTSG